MSWASKKLGDLCDIGSGGTPSRSKVDNFQGTIPWAKISDIDAAEDGVITDTEEYISELGLRAINNRLFPTGTLLLAIYGSVGKTAFAGREMSTNQAILGIRIKKNNELSARYLKYWFDHSRDSILNRAVGGVLRNISLKIVKDLEIPLPPLPIQQRIADILNTADALRRKDRELLQRYDELAQSIFMEMFGDPVRNEKGWPLRKISDIAAPGRNSIKAGPFGSSLKKESYVSNGYKVYGQEQVIRDSFEFGDYYIPQSKFDQLSQYQIMAGDLLISLVGTYGKISVVPDVFEPGIINPRLMKLTLNRQVYEPYFLKFLLQTHQMENCISNRSRGGTMDIVNVGIMKEVLVIVPELNLQRGFLRILELINRQKEIVGLRHSENLFNSLLNRSFYEVR